MISFLHSWLPKNSVHCKMFTILPRIQISNWNKLRKHFWQVLLEITNRCNCMDWILFLCLVHSTCFGRHTRPSSGVQTSTVSTATGTIIGWRRLSRLLVPEGARHCLAPSGTSSRDSLRQPMIVPVAVETVQICTPDDGRVCRPKHVEWTKQRNKIHCIQLHLLVISIELTTDIHSCLRRYSNPQSQQASGCRPTL